MVLSELGFKKINVTTIERYKGESNITIEHKFDEVDTDGLWTYYSDIVWDEPLTFKKLSDLIEYIENKRNNS